MGSNRCLFKLTAKTFPPQHCVNRHLNVSDQQTAKISAFTECLTLSDDQLFKWIWLAAPGCYLLSL